MAFRETRIRGTEDFPFEHVEEKMKNYMVESHWHPEIEVVYVAAGKVIVNVSEEKYVLGEGTILFVNPDELHSYASDVNGAEYHAAVFMPTLFQFRGSHFFEQDFTIPLTNGLLRLPRLVTKSHPIYREIQSIVRRMFYEDMHSKTLLFADLTALFCTLMEKSLLEEVQIKEQYKNLEAIKTCIQHMEEHYSDKITLSELAELVHVSQNYFCSYFKKHTGMSPFTQLHYIRIKEAAKMLLKSEVSVVDVSEACGFENMSFFIRKFKEIMGCTPSVYRNKEGRREKR